MILRALSAADLRGCDLVTRDTCLHSLTAEALSWFVRQFNSGFVVQLAVGEQRSMSATTGQVVGDAPKSDLNRPAYARSTLAQSARCPGIRVMQ